MKTTASGARARGGAFTLLELLVSMAMLVFIIAIVGGVASGVTSAWSHGEQTVENYQTGRALLEMIGREVAEAVISPRLQFVQGPSLPVAANQRVSGSLFWVAPLASTGDGNLCEIGYYLTNGFELKRFFVPPSDTANYQVLSATCGPRPTTMGGGANNSSQAALWVTNFVTMRDANSQPLLSHTAASGVLNFFVRCLDVNGDPIPWLDADLPFNSAQPAQPATPGARNDPAANRGNPSGFRYTYYNGPGNTQNTVPGNFLPSAVELTIVTTDLRTLRRLGKSLVPPTPPVDLGARDAYPPTRCPTRPWRSPVTSRFSFNRPGTPGSVILRVFPPPCVCAPPNKTLLTA